MEDKEIESEEFEIIKFGDYIFRISVVDEVNNG